jgi:hypothetical protein
MRLAARLSFISLAIFCAHSLVGAPLYSLTSTNQTFTDNPLSLGFVFTANDSFTVTSLGWFDATGNGFQSEHTVGLFDSTGNLLVSTTLAAGTGSALDQSFRYGSIDPFVLMAGGTYTLAGTTGGAQDAWTIDDYVDGFAVDPAFTIGPDAARFDYTSTFIDPTSHFSDYGAYIGPNLRGEDATAPVPEPETSILLLLGIAIVFTAQCVVRNATSSRMP